MFQAPTNRSMMVIFPSSEAIVKASLFAAEDTEERLPATFDHRCSKKQVAESDEGDSFLSDECDEKRSYTP